MRLDSVRELKQQLLSNVVMPLNEGARLAVSARRTREVVIGAADDVAVAAGPITQLSARQRTLALGIAPRGSGKDFALAIRVQRERLMTSSLLDELKKAAKGEVDVRYVGRASKRRVEAIGSSKPCKDRHRPLLIGSSIGHHIVTAGTLGCFVKDRSGNVLILSNNHVLANESRGKRNDAILQPGRLDGGTNPADRVGFLHSSVALKKSRPNYVDCASAGLDSGVEYDVATLKSPRRRVQQLAGQAAADVVDEGLNVMKFGRTTCFTKGRVTAFDIGNLVVRYDIGNLRFEDQIEVEGAGNDSFSDGGDSGSLVMTEEFAAVGLLFAGSETGGTNRRGLTFVNPIQRVLSDLKVTLLT